MLLHRVGHSRQTLVVFNGLILMSTHFMSAMTLIFSVTQSCYQKSDTLLSEVFGKVIKSFLVPSQRILLKMSLKVIRVTHTRPSPVPVFEVNNLQFKPISSGKVALPQFLLPLFWTTDILILFTYLFLNWSIVDIQYYSTFWCSDLTIMFVTKCSHKLLFKYCSWF